MQATLTGKTTDTLPRLEISIVKMTRFIAVIGVLGMLVVAGVTVIDVLSRWWLGRGITALNEIVSLMFAVAVAACLPAAAAQRSDLKLDLVNRWVSKGQALWLEVVGGMLLLLFLGILTWHLGAYAQSMAEQERVTVILAWPFAPFLYATTALFGAATLVQLIVTATSASIACRTSLLEQRRTSKVAGSYAAAILIPGCVLVIGAATAEHFHVLTTFAQEHPGSTTLIAFGLLWLGLLASIPLSATMGLIGLFGAALYVGAGGAFSAFATETAGFLTNSQVAVLPLFLMMGSFAAVAGISQDIYRLAQALLGWLPGGLALATIGGCAGFGAVTGSSVATVATFGRVSLPEMLARGYKPSLALGSVAAGGTLGALVPPSTPIILFAILTQASIGQLFIAAIGPAMLAVALYFAVVLIWARLQPGAAPACTRAPPGELRAALRQSLSCFLLFGAVIGGLYTGIFTATESAAVGSFGAFALALARGRLKGGAFWKVMAETIITTATIYSLIFGALIFAFFVGMSTLPEIAVQVVEEMNLSPLALIAVVLLAYIALGSIMDSFSILMITVPIVVPLVLEAGYDLIWWGVVMLIVTETGMISPPFGLNVFVLKSVIGKGDLMTVFRGVLPFVAADVVKLALLVIFPAIALWLPSNMYG